MGLTKPQESHRKLIFFWTGLKMSISYENQRVLFDKLLKKYTDYLELYKAINNGSLKGATPFEQFYWRMTYLSRYHDRKTFSNTGY